VFPQDAQDTTWLPEVGRRGWVVLTKDRHIRTRRNEVAELMAAGLAVFVVTKADMSGDEMALAFVAALPAMLRMAARKPRPFVARVSAGGELEMLALPERANSATDQT
jgi:GTPase